LPREIVRQFDYSPQAIHNQTSLMEQGRHYARWDVRFTLHGDPPLEGQELRLEYYRLERADPAPVIVVLPILAGSRSVARSFADYFARHGFAAVIVHTEQKNDVLRAMDNLQGAVRESVVRHRLALDWIAGQSELEPARVGVFGASLGGLNGFYLSALDSRVRASVLALAAGDLPYVLAESKQARVAEAVADLEREKGLEAAQVQAYLGASLQTDPLDLAPYMDPASIMLIMARFDDAILYSRQRQLWEALGKPEAVILPTGHVTAALYLPYLKSRALGFFRRRLLDAPAD
jgi:dienelactone hydrolase